MERTLGREGGDGPRLDYLDGLRACAALFVYFHHAWLQVIDQGGAVSPFWNALEILRPGRYAVDVFIFLSGYCLMLPVLRKGGALGGTMRFYAKRARRILPTYYAALALSLGLVWTVIGTKTGTHWDVSLPVTSKAIWTHVLMMQDVFGDTASKINHAYWSISVESRIYVLFPLLLLLWRRIGPVWTVSLATLASVALTQFLRRLNLTTDLTAWYLGLFTMGMLACDLIVAHPDKAAALRRKAPTGVLSALLFVIAGVGFTGMFGPRWGWPTYVQSFVVGLAMICLLVNVQSSGSSLRRMLEWPPLVWIGTFSYSLYLLHAPLLQVMQQYALRSVSDRQEMFLLLSTGGLLLVILLSFGFYLVFERPFVTVRKEKNHEVFAVSEPLKIPVSEQGI